MKIRAALAAGAPCAAGSTRAAAAPSAQDQILVGAKLVQYCQACHGLGALRFLHSTDPADVWATIQQQVVPGTQTLWKDAIAAALAWPTPTPTPPAQDAERAPGKAWMPRGERRLEMAQDEVGKEDARQLIVRILAERGRRRRRRGAAAVCPPYR